MLVVTTFGQVEAGFEERARGALEVLAVRPGFVRGRVGRGVDNPGTWLIATEWEGVGAWRRALSSMEVKLHAVPLLAEAGTAAAAFEVLASSDGGPPSITASGRAREPRSAS